MNRAFQHPFGLIFVPHSPAMHAVWKHRRKIQYRLLHLLKGMRKQTKPVIQWSGRRDSNPRPSAPKADALPDCATPRLSKLYRSERLNLRLPQEPRREPHDGDHWNREDRQQNKRDAEQEDVILPCVYVWLAQVPRQQIIVAAVGLPCNIEGVAQNRDRADQHIERKIDDHARERHVRHPTKPCRDHNNAGGEASKNISEERNQPNKSVESEANRRARNAKAVVKHMRQQIQIFVSKQSTADARSRR